MPRNASVYGNLLRDFIAKHQVDCWLVNTGWTGGKYGIGRRMPIRVTRRLLAAALDGSLSQVSAASILILAFRCRATSQALKKICSIPPRPGLTKPTLKRPPSN